MDFWMTFTRGAQRSQASAATARETLELVRAKQREGYELERVVDPEDGETDVGSLTLSLGGETN